MKTLGSEPMSRLHNRKVLQHVLNMHKLLEISPNHYMLLQHPECVSPECTKDLLHFQIFLQLPALSSLWRFCSFSVTYLIFFLGNLDLLYTELCCFPQLLLFFSVIFPFLLLFSAMVTSMPSTSQKSSGWATGGPEKLMQPINFARAGSVSSSNITQWEYQKTANCCIVLHRIGGLAPEDPDKHLGLAWLMCLQCRELKSVFGWEETTQPAQHQEKSLEGHASPGTALGPLDSTEEPCKDTSRNMSLVLSPPRLESGEQQQSTSFQPQVYAGWPAPVLYVCV